jgi:uncharacterized membrane protein YdbT with pleckstrin-like domain
VNKEEEEEERRRRRTKNEEEEEGGRKKEEEEEEEEEGKTSPWLSTCTTMSTQKPRWRGSSAWPQNSDSSQTSLSNASNSSLISTVLLLKLSALVFFAQNLDLLRFRHNTHTTGRHACGVVMRCSLS